MLQVFTIAKYVQSLVTFSQNFNEAKRNKHNTIWFIWLYLCIMPEKNWERQQDKISTTIYNNNNDKTIS